jgi:hypothetical protein
MKCYVPLLVLLLTVSAAAQQPAPAPPKPPPAPSAPAAPQPTRVSVPVLGQSVNIRLDVSVSDQKDALATPPKTLMVMLADGALGQTRGAFEDRSISVDATPTILGDRIRLTLRVVSSLDRVVVGPGTPQPDTTLNWQNSFSLLLESGKPMLAFETSDPTTKRKLSIEVKATIQK